MFVSVSEYLLLQDSLAMATFYADFLLYMFEDTRPLPKDYDIRNTSQVPLTLKHSFTYTHYHLYLLL